MKVWLIEANNMGRKHFRQIAYSDEQTCILKCENLEKEGIGYKPVEFEGELISKNRIIVQRAVYELNRTEPKAQRKTGVFKVGEEIEIKGGWFRVNKRHPYGIILKAIPSKPTDHK